jgi:hypothetical protein
VARRSTRQASPQNRLEQVEFGPNLPCVRAYFDGSGGAITLPGDGSETPMLWECWENGNEDVFSVTLSAGRLMSVTALVEGVFSLTMQVKLTDSLTAADHIGGAFEEGGNDLEAPAWVMPGQPLAGDNSAGMYSWTFIKGYPPVWLRCLPSTCVNAPCLATWEVNLAQDSGAPNDVLQASFEIYLLGGLSVDTSELV